MPACQPSPPPTKPSYSLRRASPSQYSPGEAVVRANEMTMQAFVTEALREKLSRAGKPKK
jgi:hypothetical protein